MVRATRRTGDIDAERTSPGPGARHGGMHPLLALQRTAGNAAVNDLIRRSNTKRDESVGEKNDAPVDLEEVKEHWRNRLQVKKGSLGQVEVLDNPGTIGELLAGWDVVPFNSKEDREARALVKALEDSTDPDDIELYKGVVNAVEQQDRQAIIGKQLGKLGGRQVLAVLGNGRLEALCVWALISGRNETDPMVDADWWVEGWERCFYIEELSSAPWNVGWPSEQTPVKGAGTALMNAAIAKAKAQNCDGIGLSALPSNVGFYEKVGFAGKEENRLSMTMALKKPSTRCVVM